MTYRTRSFDPDYRRDPKTERWCEICQRDLKEGQPHRRICYELDTWDAVHKDDWERAEIEIAAKRTHPNPVVKGLIGMDCARRLGLEWSREAEGPQLANPGDGSNRRS